MVALKRWRPRSSTAPGMQSATEGVAAMRPMRSLLAGACLLGLPLIALAQPTAQPGDPPPPANPGEAGASGFINPNQPGSLMLSTPNFQLKICNRAAARLGDAYVSIISIIENGKRYRAQGWWKIPNAQCVDVGEFKRPGVFLHGYACGGDCKWGNQKLVYCVNSKSGFDYSFDSGRDCGPDEGLAGFFPLEVDNLQPVVTQNLTGG